jgi:hypothetical protein
MPLKRSKGETTMENRERNDLFLETLASILIRSFLLGAGLLLLWFLFYLFLPDWTYEMNTKWFNIGRHEFDLINYCGIGLVKITLLLFFLFPYLSVRLVLRKKKKSI